jgi:integrase
MARMIEKLSPRRVTTAKPKRGRRALVIGDGGGLWLQCTLADDGATVRRSWVFRFQLNGRRREMGLGAAHTVSLREARVEARSLRQQLRKKIDPLEAQAAARRAKLAEQARTITFERCAQMYLDLHADGWSPKHAHQWRTSLASYILPTLGAMSVADVDEAAVMRTVQPLWKEKTVTAGRVLARIRVVLDYAAASGFRNGGNNPAVATLAALPKRARIAKVRHFEMLPWQALPDFMAKLRTEQAAASRCLEFIALTAARSGEARSAQWDEIKDGVWTIPASRMKSGREHRVPLSARALEILNGLPRAGAYVFGGNASLPEKALHRALRRLHPSATIHGMRSALRTWCDEVANYPHHVVEAALAHAIPTAVEKAYRRGDLFEKRRRLMQQWCDYLAKPAPAGVVTPMRRRAG